MFRYCRQKYRKHGTFSLLRSHLDVSFLLLDDISRQIKTDPYTRHIRHIEAPVKPREDLRDLFFADADAGIRNIDPHEKRITFCIDGDPTTRRCVLYSVIDDISEIVSFANGVSSFSGSEIFSLLLKATGLAYIVDFAADLCRDAGETGNAKRLENAGKIAILALSLPVITGLFDKVKDIFS